MLTLSRSLRRTAAKPALMHRGSLCNEDEQRCSWLHAYGTEDKADYRHVLMVMEREEDVLVISSYKRHIDCLDIYIDY